MKLSRSSIDQQIKMSISPKHWAFGCQIILVDDNKPLQTLVQKLWIQSFMSVVIKVLFGEKLYRLAPETQTLEQVDREMKQRFPSIKQLKYFYKDAEINELSAIIRQLSSTTTTTSLKITAKAEKSEALELDSSLISEIKLCETNPLETSQLLLKPQSAEPQSRIKLPNDFYICYNCSGKGILQEFSITNLCMICKGKGKLYENHKYVMRMKQLYQLHFCPTLKANSILEELKPQSKPEEIRPEIKPVVPEKKQPVFCISDDKGIEMIANAKISKNKLNIGELFSVRFQFTNTGKDWSGKTIEMIEDKEHKFGKIEGRRLTALKSGQNMAVEIGPFVCRDQSPLEKSYHLYFREGQKYIRFGHKFGFCAKAEKKVEVKKNNGINQQREKIRDLKMLSGSKKSEEYLLMKLKSLGINLREIGMDDKVLIDLIKQIN